jgi:hypothetical protein
MLFACWLVVWLCVVCLSVLVVVVVGWCVSCRVFRSSGDQNDDSPVMIHAGKPVTHSL